MGTRLCKIWLFATTLVAVGLACPMLTRPQDSPAFDAKFFQEMHWRSIGPFRGGRVVAVTGARGEPDVYYFGAVGGGVWKTNDAGRTWSPIFDSQPVASIGAIAVAPSDPQIIYVGSGEADMRSSLSTGNGMYKSIDRGKTWAQIGLSDTRHIGRILIDPKDPNRLFVAALGHAYGPNPERGVYRSIDGGRTWQRILFKDENTGAIDLSFDPQNTQVIYASLWQTRRPPWSVYAPSNGPGSGLYRSEDGGDHWEQITGHGLPTEDLGRIGIALAPSHPQRIYLVVDAKDGGLFRSEDRGQNWKRVSNDRRLWQRGWYFGELSVDPKNPDHVYLLNTASYQSIDGGITFNAWKGAPGGDDYHELWIDPDNPQRMILGCDQGAIVTHNGGATWSSWFNQPTAQFYHVATDNQFPYMIYGAQQDSGALTVPSRGKFRSLNFHDWRPIEAGDENGYIAPDPLRPGQVFGGFVTRQDLNNEEIQLTPPTLAHTGEFRRTWTLPLVYSPVDPHVLYFGSQVLFRTADGGTSWQIISPDLSRDDPSVPANLDPATTADAPAGKRRGVIYTISPSYLRAGEIWVGTDDGLIHLTQDEGKSWTNVTPPELTPWSKVTHIEASHSEPATAYAAVDRHRLDNYNPYLYRTQDLGKTWKRITRGIPEGSFLNCVREDPVRKHLLYACTERGVYVSFDDGENWQSLQLNLPMTSIRDLVIHENDLVIATFGRSFWILDDVAPLRQLDSQIAQADTFLFAPETAFRVRSGYDQSTPVPTDEPLSENPPDGAVIDYYLKETSPRPVRLEIFDASGNLVRRFASDENLFQTKPSSVPFTMNWVRDPKPLGNQPGLHRFVWDLHSALPAGMSRTIYISAGPWVIPGSYSVKLTANGKTTTQPLFIKPDPRVTATPEDLQRQFAMSSQLLKQLAETTKALQQAKDLRTQIAAREKDATGNRQILQALDDLNQKTEVAVEPDADADLTVFGLALPDKDHEPLPSIDAALTGLFAIVESADLAPSSDAATAASAWDDAAKKALARWKDILDHDLPATNSKLQKAKFSSLSLN